MSTSTSTARVPIRQMLLSSCCYCYLLARLRLCYLYHCSSGSNASRSATAVATTTLPSSNYVLLLVLCFLLPCASILCERPTPRRPRRRRLTRATLRRPQRRLRLSAWGLELPTCTILLTLKVVMVIMWRSTIVRVQAIAASSRSGSKKGCSYKGGFNRGSNSKLNNGSHGSKPRNENSGSGKDRRTSELYNSGKHRSSHCNKIEVAEELVAVCNHHQSSANHNCDWVGV